MGRVPISAEQHARDVAARAQAELPDALAVVEARVREVEAERDEWRAGCWKWQRRAEGRQAAPIPPLQVQSPKGIGINEFEGGARG
jgi:hypothetical protein